MKFDHEHGSWTDDPDGQGYYEVKTWWRSFEDFVAWTNSPDFAAAHSSRPPKDMFSGPNVLEVHDLLTSTDLDVGATDPVPADSRVPPMSTQARDVRFSPK